MAKRKLTKQQQHRIKKRQQATIDQVDKTADTFRGQVVASYNRKADVKVPDQENTGFLPPDGILRCHLRSNLEPLAVGDEVIIALTDNHQGVIQSIRNRRSVIYRPDGLGKLKPVAANIDQVFIVITTQPEAHPNLIDRYLVAAENAGIASRIIINKSDLIAADDPVFTLRQTYEDIGYAVDTVSCALGEGLDTLQKALTNKVSIFAGQSGVGKSSLINALIPHQTARVGELSQHVTKGRHTTTNSSLFELPQGGSVIDSPGIREFHLPHLTREEIFKGYRELQPCLGHCQFRDCQHEQEPGCAVRTLIESSQMAASRQNSLSYILQTLTE